MSGDAEGLSDEAEARESVAELVKSGQYFEAEVVDGVENAPDADEGEVVVMNGQRRPRTAKTSPTRSCPVRRRRACEM